MNPKKIFICSTCHDFKDLRAELKDILKNWGYEPLVSDYSEEFPVERGVNSYDACVEAVKKSEILILIVGTRYGGKVPRMDISITELEYNTAVDNDIPRINFCLKEVWNYIQIWKKNPDMKFPKHFRDGHKVMEFLERIRKVKEEKTDNWIHKFETSVEIKKILKTQLGVKDIKKDRLDELNEYLSNLIVKCRRDDFLDLAPSRVPAENIFVPLSLFEDHTIAQFDSQSEKMNQGYRETHPRNPDADNVFGDLIEHQKSAVILGIPGSGKTKLLRHWCNILAVQARPMSSTPLPLLTSAIQLTRAINAKQEGGDKGLEQVLARGLEVSMELARELSFRLKAGKAVLLIDGLDEVPDGDQQTIGREGLEAWLESLTENPNLKLLTIVITCRKANYLRPLKFIKTHFLIKEFNSEQIEQFTQLWFEKDVSIKFMNQYRQNPVIQKLSENPLLLKLVCLLYSRYPQETLPLKRVEICKKAAKMLLEDWETHHRIPPRNQVDITVKFQVLEGIALEMIEEIHRELPVSRLYEIIYDTKQPWCGFEPHVILKEIVTSGLILLSHEKKYSFVLPTFLEFFAASGLHRQGDWVEQIGRLAQKKTWHGALSFLALNSKDAERLSSAILEFDPILAYDSTKEWKLNEFMQHRLMKALIQSLHSPEYEYLRRWTATEIIMKRLEITPSPNEMAVIFKNLPDSMFYFLNWWAEKIIHAEEELARNAFVQSLEIEGSFRKQISLRKLGEKELGKPVIQKVRQMINSPNPPEQWEAIHALGTLLDRDSLELLRAVVQDHSRHRLVRSEASRVLGRLGEKHDISSLQEIAEKEEWVLSYFAKIGIQEISHRYGIQQVIKNQDPEQKLAPKHNWKDILTTSVSLNWEVSEVYYGEDPRWILHVIEQGYNDWDTMWNEVEFLYYAVAELGISCICTEGGSTDSDFKYLRGRAELPNRIEKALGLFKDSVIHSEEYLCIATDLEFLTVGIEDRAEYDRAAEGVLHGDLSKIDRGERLDAMAKNILRVLCEKKIDCIIVLTVPSGIIGGVVPGLTHRLKQQGLCYARIEPKSGKYYWPMKGDWRDGVLGTEWI